MHVVLGLRPSTQLAVARRRARRACRRTIRSARVSPTTTGDDLISDRVLNVHAALPSATFTAWTTPSRSPTKTRPPATAGDDSPIDSPALYRQRSLPSARPIASSSPVRGADVDRRRRRSPRTSRRPRRPPRSRQFALCGIVVAETPVSDGVPRNCGQRRRASAGRWARSQARSQASSGKAQAKHGGHERPQQVSDSRRHHFGSLQLRRLA